MRFHKLTNRPGAGIARLFPAALLAMLLLPGIAVASVEGITGTSFDLTARAGTVSSAPGESVYVWGYANGRGTMQLPGPTLIVTEGQTINVTLHNALPVAAGNVSIVFPGQVVSTSGGVPGALTQEAPNGGSVMYTFTANRPGTFQYHSGSQPDLQVEMGLYGALVVRPSAASITAAGCPAGMMAAYGHPETCYDREYLFLLSEIDLDIHQAAALQVGGPGPIVLPVGAYASEFWLMNGRTGPDTMADFIPPRQRYPADTTLRFTGPHASRREGTDSPGRCRPRVTSVSPPWQPRPGAGQRRAPVAERHGPEQARGSAPVHTTVDTGWHHRCHLGVDRQEPRLGYLRAHMTSGNCVLTT